MLSFEWASLFETVGYKLAERKGLREGWDSKELWKSVEMSTARLLGRAKCVAWTTSALPTIRSNPSSQSVSQTSRFLLVDW